MTRVIGCIGLGNMGSALMGGFAAKLDKSFWSLRGYNRSPQKMADLAKLGIEPCAGLEEVASQSDLLIFAVKPAQMPEVLIQARPFIKKSAIVLSIAAGFSIASMRRQLGEDMKLVRCMPTTTALAGRGIFAFCHGGGAFCGEELADLLALFGKLGLCMEIAERQFPYFSALIGAGPAYVFAVMHALAQAGLTLGFGREPCAKMLVELFAGSAALAAASGKTFMDLRDDVCSPAGLTIAGINTLDRGAITGLFVDAALAAAKRAEEMES